MADNANKPVKFKYGNASTFETITKDDNTIYFIHNDTTNDNRIYVGNECFNVTVVSNLDDANISDLAVPSVRAAKEGLNKKVSKCDLVTITDSDLQSYLTLANNTEYRGLDLTDVASLTIDVDENYTPRLFYSSVILHAIDSSDTVADFVQVRTGSDVVIRFLNGDTDLGGMDTAEFLFFSNGLDICCIAYAYNSEEE